MAASRPNRVSGTAGRRISGSPRSRRRPRGRGTRRSMRDNAPAECGKITRDIAVRDAKPPRPSATPGSLWPLRNSWNRATENLFSAWIEKLFDAPLDTEPSWPALHEVLRDNRAMSCSTIWVSAKTKCRWRSSPTAPTWCTFCAPISHSRWACRSAIRSARAAAAARRRSATSGSALTIPTPRVRLARAKNLGERAPRRSNRGSRRSFAQYLPVVGDAVQSGAVRTLATDDNTDFYTVPLTQGRVAPGHHLRRSLRARSDAGAARAAGRTARRASSSPSTRSPTGRSRASGFGAAISCSCTIPRSAAPASSASGRSCAARTAACAG